MILFNRLADVKFSNGIKLSNKSGAKITFIFSTDNGSGLPYCRVKIQNIAKDIINLIDDNLLVSLIIGFEDNKSELASGQISNIEEERSALIFDITSNERAFNKKVNKWYSSNTRYNFILEDIAKNADFKLLGSSNLEEFKTAKAVTITGTAGNSIINICNEKGFKVTTQGSTLIIYSEREESAESKQSKLIIDEFSGLIGVSKSAGNEKKWDYVIESLPIAQLKNGDIIKVKSYLLNAKCKIINFDISAQDNWIAKYKIKVIN